MVFRIINFILLATILYFLLKKPVKDFFASRHLILKATVEEARQAYSRSIQQSQEIEGRLKNLEKESREMTQQRVEEAEAEGKLVVQEARLFADRLKEDFKKVSEGELKRAREELRKNAADLAQIVAEQIIRKEMTTEDQQRLTRSYLERLNRLH